MAQRLTRVERQARTREDLVAAAQTRFIDHGFHATSLDQIAADAGYTKGAVYSNFASKEELFFAVYERQADRVIAEVERVGAEGPATAALDRLAQDTAGRRGREDGWLAVFVEFWAHVVRNPELRARFAEIHERAFAPFERLAVRVAEEQGGEPTVEPRRLVAAMNAMQLGLGLERLTRPDVVDERLGADMGRLVMEASLNGVAAAHGGGAS
jgi:AcrR family transcriptional regulator